MNEVADSSGVPQKGWMRERESTTGCVKESERESSLFRRYVFGNRTKTDIP